MTIRAEELQGSALLYEGRDAFAAQALAGILSATGGAFEEFAVERVEQRLQLQVSGVRVGSVAILLDVVGMAQLGFEYREVLASFMTHIGELCTTLSREEPSTSGKPISEGEAKAVEAITKPVAQGGASSVSLVNNGVIIVQLDQRGAKRLSQSVKKRKRLKGRDRPSPVLNEAMIHRIAAEEALRGEMHGTALLVESEWYARLVGGQGVLVPLRGGPELRDHLKHNQTYRFRGQPLTDARGYMVGINVLDAVPIGIGK